MRSNHSANFRYLILDGAVENVARITYSLDDKPEFIRLYQGTRLESLIDASPCLVKPSSGSRLWHHEDQWRSLGVEVRSPVGIERLAAHCRSLMTARLPDRQSGFMRFYAPGPLSQLLSALSRDEMREFSGPIREWWYFSSGWASVTVAEPQSQPKDASEEGWFQLTQAHLAAMASGKEQAFLRKLAGHLNLHFTPETQGLLEEWTRQASAHGCQSEADIATYAELRHTYGERLDAPEAQSMLNDSGSIPAKRLAMVDQHLAYGGA